MTLGGVLELDVMRNLRAAHAKLRAVPAIKFLGLSTASRACELFL